MSAGHIERALSILESAAAYPPEGHKRRTEDGYPLEVVYDEFAYTRMVDTYREAMTEAATLLKEAQPTPTTPNARDEG